MWALPNISAMNKEAANKATIAKLTRQARTLKVGNKKMTCDFCDKKATAARLWYDIFSDDPKGILATCQKHEDCEEGYFYCEDCGRLMVENYTWERYESNGLCLNCLAKRTIADTEEWIMLDDASIAGLTFDRVRQAKHLIAVSGPVPEGLLFHSNVEFDNMDGHAISGGGVSEMQNTMRELRGQGYTRIMLVLDAAYQFAVSIGIYTDAKEGARLTKAA